VALLDVLSKVHKKELLKVFHYHHGPGENQDFRNQAAQFVKELSRRYQISLVWEKSRHQLSGEAQCREARRQALKKHWKKGQWIATGHHAEDLLETRLIRLIRGTGAQGLCAMSEAKKPWLRPFLDSEPRELKKHLKSLQQAWLEDPTNENPKFLRNWLRHQWLPQLEKQRPGARRVLARSFENIVSSVARTDLAVPKGKKLSRSYYLACTRQQQRELLSRWFFAQGLRNFSRAQIEELQKQLDKSQNELSVKIGELKINVNAQQILLIPS